MVRNRHRITVALCALMAGCGGDSAPTPAPPTNGTVATSLPASPQPPTPAPVLPEALTVTTNEPFYAAAIERDAIRLSGVDLPERRIPIAARTPVPGGMRWQAGELVVTVTDRACEDDMSGQARPFSATLRIGGRTARGCAFPTPPRATPSVTAGAIPARFVGRWDRDAAACAAPAISIEGVTITPGELRFHESLGEVVAVEPAGDALRITARYSGEGENWTTRQSLRIDGDRLTITGEGAPIRRVRC